MKLKWFMQSSKNVIEVLLKRESVLSVTLVLETMKRDIKTMETSLTEISTITSGWNELLKSQPNKWNWSIVYPTSFSLLRSYL